MKAERKGRLRIASFRELVGYLKEDYATNNNSRQIWTFWTAGFQALAVYRISVWCVTLKPRIVRAPVRLVCWFLAFFVRNFFGVELPTSARIGRRMRIAHQHGIVLHTMAEIGDDCTLRQGVTIGIAGRSPFPPRLGDRVSLGAGAVVAGDIVIGDDVSIGPNAVVMTDVPSNSVVLPPQPTIRMRSPRPKHEADASGVVDAHGEAV